MFSPALPARVAQALRQRVLGRSAREEKADSTRRSSRAVPHPSTNRALRRLTSEVRRDPVHSTRYGRRRSHMPGFGKLQATPSERDSSRGGKPCLSSRTWNRNDCLQSLRLVAHLSCRECSELACRCCFALQYGSRHRCKGGFLFLMLLV